MQVPTCAADVTAEWLTAALRERELISGEVAAVSFEVVGQGVGLMAELARLHVTYAGKETLPATIIAKTAARNQNRDVARLLDFYRREVNFYNRIGQACPFRVPISYYGAVDEDSYDFILLLEDLGDVAPNDQITGSTEQEAYEKVASIAKLHARFWNKTEDADSSWMYDTHSKDELVKLRDFLYQPAVEPTIEKFAEFFDETSRKLVREVGERYAEATRNMSSHYTFIHGDFRQDNFIYRKGDNDAVVMDWQISGKGHPIFDFTYFVCQSLQVDLRREIERELLMHYLETLRAEGVEDYDMATAWHDYRQLTLFCLVYPIVVCGTLDTANDRGRALAECMLERNLEVISDLDADQLLD